MSELALNSNTLTMTSREIAGLVESRHADVCRTVDRLMEKKVIQGYAPTAYTHPQNGRTYYEYRVNKRDSYVVVAQLCPEFTARLVDRWQELEQASVTEMLDAIPKTKAGLLRLAADQEERIEQQQEEIKAKDSDIERLQGVCETIASQFVPGMTPPDFARLLNGVNTRALQAWMVEQGMLLNAHKGYKATSYYRDRYLTQRVTEAGELPGRPYVVLTTIGAKLIYKKYLKGELPMKKTWDGKFTHDLFMEQAA